eukprot:GFUD01014405.1.p1 GENE.GFUD01014405.1~~GFUD01014405.1.p1  ORF type:complete len:735 (+),score=104.42 GFUD01014405.1:71-2275(+)
MEEISLVIVVSLVGFSQSQLIDIEYADIKGRNIKIDYDTCDAVTYDTDYYLDTCHHDNFPIETISDMFDKPIPECCGFHGYFTYGACEGRDNEGRNFTVQNVHICQNPNEAGIQYFEKPSIKCNSSCILKTEEEIEDQIKFEKNAVLNFGGEIFPNFCMTHLCDGDAWQLTIDICDCSNIKEINEDAKQAVPQVDLCCGENGVLDVARKSCLIDGKSSGSSCSSEDSDSPFCCGWKTKEKFSVVKEEALNNDTLNLTCIGAIRNHSEDFAGGISCQPACQGASPCIRYCCPFGQVWDSLKITCQPSDQITSLRQLTGLNITKENIEDSSWHEPCTPIQLFPQHSCQDAIEFLENGNIVVTEKNITLKYGEFCITNAAENYGKGDIMVQACLPKSKHSEKIKFEFYPYILLLSVFCLCITIIVYLLFPALISQYSKIMINFALCLLIAFLVLTAIQKPKWFLLNGEKEFSRIACRVLGHLNQYFFLCAFTWMTIMSYEIFKQLKGLKHVFGSEKSNSILGQALTGYGLPLVTCFITLLVELYAPFCSPYRPKFGHRSCLFYGKLDKFLWFYGPILLMLMINSCMFCYISFTICKNSMFVAGGNQTKGGFGKELMDKGCLYLRLFLGMGVIWYFEIISWYTGNEHQDQKWAYVFDVINMMQGVWVFLIFVCKRNVLKVILKQKDKLYSTVRRNTLDSTSRVRYQRKSDESTSRFSQSFTRTERVTMSEMVSQDIKE